MFKQVLIDNFGFDVDSQKALLRLFTEKTLHKGSIFAKSGEYSKQIAFVNEGVMRAYFIKKNGEEYNKTFFTRGSFLGAYSSLITGQKNLINIECLTDCDLFVASYESVQHLYEDYPKIERLARILAEQFFVYKEKREIELVTLEAKDRYAIFQREYPGLEQIIPQYHIASYLGVSATQLSRIRALKNK